MEHRVTEIIRKTIADHALLEEGVHVVAGLSGGPDSTCLFHALASLRAELGFGLSAVHVNHGLRPVSAERDARSAETFCRALGAPFYGFALDVAALARARGVGEEEAGREARYEAFYETAARISAENALPAARVRVAVAHNRNDQAETVLMRVIRGTGPDGLAAMPYRRESREGFAVIRPLLDVPRALVEEYCAAHGLAPVRDHSNEEAVYVRNKIRLALLPELESGYNGNIVETLVRLASNAAEDRAYFHGITDGLLEKGRLTADGALEMPLAPVARAHTALRRRLIVRCFESVGLAQDIAAVHLRAADALIESGRTGKTVDFPNGYRLSLRYGHLLFFAADKTPPPAAIREWALPFSALSAAADGAAEKDGERVFTAEAGAYTVKISLRPAPLQINGSGSMEGPTQAAPATVAFDFELLARVHDGLSVRGRRAGDRIRPEGMNGAKSVQDLFVDAKLPRESRDAVPLVAAGSEILCVCAARRLGRKTGDYTVTSATKWILLVEYMKQM